MTTNPALRITSCKSLLTVAVRIERNSKLLVALCVGAGRISLDVATDRLLADPVGQSISVD